MRWITRPALAVVVVATIALFGVVVLLSGCVIVDKEAAKLLLAHAEKIAAKGSVDIRDLELSAMYRVEQGMVFKLDGFDVKAKIEGERDTAPMP